MKTIIVYDSAYGNTEKIATAIGNAISPGEEATLLRVSEAKSVDWSSLRLLVVGSPTQGGRPTPAIQEFLSKIPAGALKNVGVTAFDTRFSISDHNIGLRLLMQLLGFAAGRIARALQDKGGILVAPPEGFIVEGKEGPLKQGEVARAANWATSIDSTQSRLQIAGA